MNELRKVHHADMIPECPNCKKEIAVSNKEPIIHLDFDGKMYECGCGTKFDVTSVKSYICVEIK